MPVAFPLLVRFRNRELSDRKKQTEEWKLCGCIADEFYNLKLLLMDTSITLALVFRSACSYLFAYMLYRGAFILCLNCDFWIWFLTEEITKALLSSKKKLCCCTLFSCLSLKMIILISCGLLSLYVFCLCFQVISYKAMNLAWTRNMNHCIWRCYLSTYLHVRRSTTYALLCINMPCKYLPLGHYCLHI